MLLQIYQKQGDAESSKDADDVFESCESGTEAYREGSFSGFEIGRDVTKIIDGKQGC